MKSWGFSVTFVSVDMLPLKTSGNAFKWNYLLLSILQNEILIFCGSDNFWFILIKTIFEHS